MQHLKSKNHWENVYRTKTATEVSWFQSHADLSVKLIRDFKTSRAASIIDVGGGTSVLVDDLLGNGYKDLTVLDLSGTALSAAKSRLGVDAGRVKWVEANILDVELTPAAYDVWHDRAVFHFLADDRDRNAYVSQVLHAVKAGGLVIVATFAEDGPAECSGLPVMRYSAARLHSEFGEWFELLGHEKETHYTPGGKEQKFVYCFCRRLGSSR